MLGWGLSEFDLEIIAGNMHSFEGAGLQNFTCPCENVLQDIWICDDLMDKKTACVVRTIVLTFRLLIHTLYVNFMSILCITCGCKTVITSVKSHRQGQQDASV